MRYTLTSGRLATPYQQESRCGVTSTQRHVRTAVFGKKQYTLFLHPMQAVRSTYTETEMASKSIGKISKLHTAFREAIQEVYPDFPFAENVRPDWLRSDSGYPLELDFYFETIDMAVEIQGQQHYRYIPYFHGKLSGFDAQRRRDNLKKRICFKKQVVLLFIKDDESLSDVLKVIISRVELLGRYRPMDNQQWETRLRGVIHAYNDVLSNMPHYSDSIFVMKYRSCINKLRALMVLHAATESQYVPSDTLAKYLLKIYNEIARFEITCDYKDTAKRRKKFIGKYRTHIARNRIIKIKGGK